MVNRKESGQREKENGATEKANDRVRKARAKDKPRAKASPKEKDPNPGTVHRHESHIDQTLNPLPHQFQRRWLQRQESVMHSKTVPAREARSVMQHILTPSKPQRLWERPSLMLRRSRRPKRRSKRLPRRRRRDDGVMTGGTWMIRGAATADTILHLYILDVVSQHLLQHDPHAERCVSWIHLKEFTMRFLMIQTRLNGN